MPAKPSREQPTRRSLRTRLKEPSPVAVTIAKPRGRKRKIPASFDESPTKEKQLQKKSRDGRDIDIYCWECHKLGQDEVCSTCPRVYHRECLGKANQFNEEGACAECQLESLDGTKLSPSLSCRMLKQLLSFAMNRVADKKNGHSEKFLASWLAKEDISKLCNVIDLVILVDKMNDDVSYTKPVEFFSDVKWIIHNCHIMYGADGDRTIAANGLIKDFKSELMDIEACPDCYYNMHAEAVSQQPSFFTRVCKEPHVIVWAKMKGFPYWPAKCVKVVNGVADVRFFGTHDKSRVPVSKCYLISSRYPTGKSPKQAKYLHAMAELAEYIVNYERKFNHFTYAAQQTPVPANLDDWFKNVDKQYPGRIDKGPQFISMSESSFIERKSDLPCFSVSDIDFNPDMLQERTQAVFNNTDGNIVSSDDVRNAIISNVHSTSDFEPIELDNCSSVEDINFVSLTEQPGNRESSDPVSVCMTFSADDEGNNESSNIQNDAPLITPFSTVSSLHKDTDSVLDATNSLTDATGCTFVTEPVISDSAMPQEFSVSYKTSENEALNNFPGSSLPIPEEFVVPVNDTKPRDNDKSNESESNLDIQARLNSGYLSYNEDCSTSSSRFNQLTKEFHSLQCHNSVLKVDDISVTEKSPENANISHNKGYSNESPQCADVIEIPNTPSITTDVLEYVDDGLYICHSSSGSRSRSSNLSHINRLLYTTSRRTASRHEIASLCQAIFAQDPFLVKTLQEFRFFIDLFVIRIWALVNKHLNAPEVIVSQHTKMELLQKRVKELCGEVLQLKSHSESTLNPNASKELPAIEAAKLSDSHCEAIEKSDFCCESEKKSDYGTEFVEKCDSDLSAEKNNSDIEFVGKDGSNSECMEQCDSDIESVKKSDSKNESSQNRVGEACIEEYERYAIEKIEALKLEHQKQIETNIADIEALRGVNETLQSEKQRLEKENQILFNELKELTKSMTSQGSQTILGQSEVVTVADIDKMVSEKLKMKKSKWSTAKEHEVTNAMTSDWCIICTKPANIHCCLNTNYCDTNCQQKHLSRHSSTCERLSQHDFPSTSGVMPNSFCADSSYKRLSQHDFSSTSGVMPNSFCADSAGSQQVMQSANFQTRSVTTIQVSSESIESVAANIISSNAVYGGTSVVTNPPPPPPTMMLVTPPPSSDQMYLTMSNVFLPTPNKSKHSGSARINTKSGRSRKH